MLRTLFFLFALLLAPLAWAGPVDLNTGTAADFETLPGIGPSKAAAIVEYRNAHGPFQSVAQLDDVPGIGPATLANLEGLVVVGAPAAGAAQAPAPASTPPAPAPETAAAAPAGSTGKVNINAATAAELETLPGIGPTKAAAILEDRSTNGPFASCQDLSRVTGIGPATVSAVADLCTVK